MHSYTRHSFLLHMSLDQLQLRGGEGRPVLHPPLPHHFLWPEVTHASAVSAPSELLRLKCCACFREKGVGACVCLHVAHTERVGFPDGKGCVVVKRSPLCPEDG